MFYPERFAAPVDNDSEIFDYDDWVRDGWELKIGWQKLGAERRAIRAPPPASIRGRAVGFSCRARRQPAVLAARTSTRRCRRRPAARASRSTSASSISTTTTRGLGAPNVDNRSRGSALRDYVMLAIWVIGPAGAGKSRLVASAHPRNVVDQDAELERLVTGPYDWPNLGPLRRLATERAWSRVPALRAAGEPIVFETTGDKPELLAVEVAAGHAAGYREIGVGLRVPLEVCLARNRARARVLPDDVVIATWHAFEQHLPDYARILDSFQLVTG